jgi:hypothetical protein
MPVEREDKILAIDLAASALCSQWGRTSGGSWNDDKRSSNEVAKVDLSTE